MATVTSPIVSPLAMVGDTVYAGDAGKVLAPFSLPKLVRGKERPLDGLCALGPVRVGDGVLVSTDDGQLLCLTPRDACRGKTSCRYGPFAGLPLRVGGHYLLAAANGACGELTRRPERSWESRNRLSLATGPVAFGGQLLVGGHDGTLYEVRQP